MLSDEEKKAIEMLDKYITEHKLFNIKQADNLEDNIRIILNLIEKQSKEIEELKEKNRQGKMRIVQLENEMRIVQLENEIAARIEDVNQYYTPNDKIKAKIEEIDEVLKGQLIEKIRVYFEAQKEVLQSLLEKE